MHRLKITALLIFPVLAFLCLSDTAQGQTITVQNSSAQTVTTVTFSVPAGTNQSSATAQQTLTVIPSTGPATLTVTQQNQGSFLYLNGFDNALQLNSVPTTGSPLTVAVNTIGLSAGSSTSTTFTICYASTATCATIGVTLNVTTGSGGGSGTLTSVPSNASAMNFTAVQGATGSSPTTQNLQIMNTAASLGYTINATTQTGGSWLLVNSTTSTSGVENSATPLLVSVSSTILPTLTAGTYNGTLTATDTAGNTISISVVLTVGTGQALTPSQTSLLFVYQAGGTVPTAQTLTLTSNSGIIQYAVQLSSVANWLNYSATGGVATNGTPGTIDLSVNTTGAGLIAGSTYKTNLIITPFQGTPLTIPVTLVVTNSPPLQLSQSSLTFQAAFAGASPASQTVQVTALGGSAATGFTASPDQSWLSVSPNSGTTPATLTVTVNTSAQPVGTFTGHINVQPADGSYTEPITVSLTVSNSGQIYAAPSTLLFSYETTHSVPQPQSVTIQSGTGTATNFVITQNSVTCNNSATWVTATPSSNTTPATMLVSVSAAGMSAGICTGTIGVTPSGSTTSVNINVTLAVTTNTPELTIQQQPGFGYFTVQQTVAGVAPQQQSLGVSSTDGTSIPFTVIANSDRLWLSASSGGNTPQNVIVQANAAGLSAGTYSGTITVTSANLPAGLTTPNTFTIPIIMVVTPNVTVTTSASSLAFNYIANGTAPANQNLTLTAAGGVASYTASVANTNNCPSLLSVSPSSGTLNPSGTIQVSIASTASNAGTINCQIALTYLNAASQGATIPVTLTVAPAVTVTAAPTSLTFAYTVNSAAPAAQQLTVSSTGGSVQFSVGTTTTSGGNWLSVDTTSGTTAGSGTTLTKVVNVSINTQSLTGSNAAGTYTGSISITSPGVLSTAITIPVTLTVTAPILPMPTIVTNNASNVAGVIAPGELITLKGTLLGPTTAANFTLNSSGGVSNTLAGVQVTFNNIPGTPIYVSATQINVTVPWEINGQTSANIVVTYNGNASTPINVSVNSVAPAIYTLNSTGSGQAAALNQNGTYNGPAGSTTIPAPPNSVIVLYATGCGQTSPPGTTGSVAPTASLQTVTAPVSVAFGPLNNPLYGKVTFIGAAPGLVTGVCQVNVQLPTVPTGVNLSGNQLVTLTVNGVSSPQGPTVALQ